MRTEVFNALPRKEKKILVAKDVLASVNKEKYIAQRGVYCYLSYTDASIFEKDAKKHLKDIVNCTVCAVGAALVSTVKYANTLTIGELEANWQTGTNYDDDEFDKKAQKSVKSIILSVFTPREIALMEACFEDGIYFYAGYIGLDKSLNNEEIRECAQFYSNHKYGVSHASQENVLIEIMKIIAKKGRFTITDVKESNKLLSLQEA